MFPKYFGFRTELAEKNVALLAPLRLTRAMKPCSASSYSRRSDTRTSVGAFVSFWPMLWKLCMARFSTAPPLCGPITFGHQRYFAKLSDSREANAKAAFPHR